MMVWYIQMCADEFLYHALGKQEQPKHTLHIFITQTLCERPRLHNNICIVNIQPTCMHGGDQRAKENVYEHIKKMYIYRKRDRRAFCF